VAARKHADQVNAQLLNWLTRVEATGRPTFALLNYFDVHEPYFAPEPFRRRYSERVTRRNMLALYRGDGVPKPATPEELQLVIDAYDGALAYLDHALGKLRAELERRALLDRTILIITADHGEEFNERGRVGHDSSNLRQEIVRVPLIVRYPARVPAGTRVARPVSLRQIPATVTSLLRLRQPSPYGHASLFATGESEEPVLTEIGANYAVIWSGWHLWVNRKGAVELYDIYADPAQRTNLAGRPETAEIQTRLREQLAKLAPESTRPPAAGPRYESDR
jgi:arylsulfatase A-like enzyme